MAYHFVLVIRDNPHAKWWRAFGSANKETANAKKEEWRADDKARKIGPRGASDCYLVITTKSAQAKHINAAIARLNRKELA